MPGRISDQLERYELFADLDRDDLGAIAERVRREQFRAGDILTQQGEPGLNAYFIESGTLRILWTDLQGVEQEVGRLEAGEYFGETSLLLGEPHDATVQVAEDATLLRLDKTDFDGLLKERPDVLGALRVRREVRRKLRAPRFKWQDADEVVVLVLRKHISVLVMNLLIPALVFLAILVGIPYLGSLSRAAWTTAAVLSLLPLLLGLYLVFDYYNDKYVLTNRRVVHDERHLLIYETRNEAPLRAVQNVQQVQEGVLAHLFGYGDLVIETAGERGQIVFRRIPEPQETQEVIFEQIMRVQTVDRATERAAIRDALQVRFGLQAVEPPLPDQATPPAAEKPGLTTTSLLKMLVSAFQFFVPPLVYREGDTITWRKHWVALLRPISLPTLGILVATAVALAILYRGSPDLRASTLAGYGVALMFLLPWWLWRFTDWRNDVYQLTASRIVDVERRPFFLREERREANLSMIQNINLEIPGIIGRIFNFGSITIETAGAGAFTFDHIRDPRSVQTEIFRRMEQFQQQQRQRAMQDRRAELLNWFSMYDQLRDSGK